MNLHIPTDNETQKGWRVNGRLVHPVDAYTTRKAWFDSFLAQFPDKAKRIQDYDKKHGRTNVGFYGRWMPVVINWLNKNYGGDA